MASSLRRVGGELIFYAYMSIPTGKADYRALKDERDNFGRNPSRVAICPAVYVIVGETMAIAKEKLALAESTGKEIDQLPLLAEGLNFNFGSKTINEPFTEEEFASFSGLHALQDRVVELKGDIDPTVRDFIGITGRGTLAEHPVFCGAPSQAADELEAWFTAPACDGFVLAATSMLGTYEDFVRSVVPELQCRGLYHNDYMGTTLRENLGLPLAELGTGNVSLPGIRYDGVYLRQPRLLLTQAVAVADFGYRREGSAPPQ